MIDEKKLMTEINNFYYDKVFDGNYIVSQAFAVIFSIISSQSTVDVPDTNVGEWKRTAEEKPDYTRHVIITYGSSRHASKYGYYFKKEDKWYRDYRCIEEIEPPYAWTEMPEVPEEFVCGVCCG